MTKNPLYAAFIIMPAFLGPYAATAAGFQSSLESSGYLSNQKPRSDARLSLEEDRLRINAAVTLQTPNNTTTQVLPRLSSAFAISDHLGMESRIDLAEWNSHADLLQATVDNRLRYRTSGSFFNEFEGGIRQSPDGQSRQIFKVGVLQIKRSSERPTPLAIRSKATVETTIKPAGASIVTPVQSQRIGLETTINGLMPNPGSSRNALSLKFEQSTGAQPESTSSLSYDQSWTLRNITRIGFNFRVLHRDSANVAAPFQSSLRLFWRTQF
ncbi:MAG: hypothetical protein AB7T07_06230 [Steroidobacteraceae bacterium]